MRLAAQAYVAQLSPNRLASGAPTRLPPISAWCFETLDEGLARVTHLRPDRPESEAKPARLWELHRQFPVCPGVCKNEIKHLLLLRHEIFCLVGGNLRAQQGHRGRARASATISR